LENLPQVMTAHYDVVRLIICNVRPSPECSQEWTATYSTPPKPRRARCQCLSLSRCAMPSIGKNILWRHGHLVVRLSACYWRRSFTFVSRRLCSQPGYIAYMGKTHITVYNPSRTNKRYAGWCTNVVLVVVDDSGQSEAQW